MAFIKCRINSCARLIGPLRQKVSDVCYQCDVNLEKWSKQPFNKRAEWFRRVNMFKERQEVLPRGSLTGDDVNKYVHRIVTAAIRQREKTNK
jgi:hypothetical protein